MPTVLRPSRRRFALSATALVGLAACNTAPPAPAHPALTYGHKGVLRFAAARIDIDTEWSPPLRRPNIDHQVPMPPVETLQRWGRDRLLAAGGAERYVRFVVREASLTESDLPRSQGVRGALTTEQAQRYDLALAAAVEMRQVRGGLVEASAEARATRFRTVAEGISLAERERAWYDLLEQGMNDLDAELERRIRMHFAMHLV
jgi:hypothetical protein